MKKIILFFIVLFNIQGSKAQNEDLLLQFNSAQVNNHVQLNFTLAAGAICNGITIYRSENAIDFLEIGDIQGVCGSYDRNESYSFIDYSPVKNKVNYYRLQLGNLGYSYLTELFFLEFSESKPLTFPNPVTGESKIYFLNPSNEEVTLRVFSCEGKLLYVSSPSRESSFLIHRNNFKPGIYFFTHGESGNQRFEGKFLVQ